MTNEKGLGKAQRKALDFIRTVNGWHSFASDVRGPILSLASRGLVEVSEVSQQFRAIYPKNCDQCSASIVHYGGVSAFCHEVGCPNEKKEWVAERGEWVRFVDCFICGFPVEAGEQCGCCEETGGESEADEQA